MPKDVKVGKAPFQKRKQLERDIEHVTQEMYKRNKELAETNKTLSLLRNIDALVLESHASLKLVCEHITEAITQATDYPFIGLFTRTSHATDEIRLYGWSGKDYLGSDLPTTGRDPLRLRMSDEWLGAPEGNRLLALDHLSPDELSNHMEGSLAEHDRALKQLPVKTIYQVKLFVRRRVVGVLVAGFYTAANEVAESDILLIDRLSDSIGVALDNKLLFEENQRVVHQLRESNAKLRALDEAKDDFVSMASHQLRTPLTSVKGYVSMVLEGDTGPISDNQRKLLNQAFSSSQRMVYLIADLLNVSRLRTGKFVIDPTPVNLAEIVEQELAQLKETAATRSLKLIYNKPKDFPELMLDETKIRQLIMNFADNAIYYTPAGKKISVEVVDNPVTIELRVIDQGIGVPKSEQHHLFTKFYRAGNARKARPDGTGLGLFMAKKVIVAQGGSLIFESKEGEGSTFGFTFSKAKLAVPTKSAPKA
ncbi:hypothetical protein COY17_04340 [Candidatus Saccharibacteria bacterium CG_4_10_14_0_2_um_filter_52_9]|nr:MAG: hypothetical protein COY17_04340 [Candidatus Saccharibacteria bacterium CG_4_10_14_0_2_um_filter_52_9]